MPPYAGPQITAFVQDAPVGVCESVTVTSAVTVDESRSLADVC